MSSSAEVPEWLGEQCSVHVGILLLAVCEIFHGQKFRGIQITVTCLWQAHKEFSTFYEIDILKVVARW